MLITSADNKLIKYAASLKNKKYRDLHGEFLAEGLRSVADIFAHAPDSVRHVFVSQAWTENLSVGNKIESNEWQLERFLQALPDEKLVQVPQQLLKKLSDTLSPQEIVAVVGQKPQSDVTEQAYCVYLDRIRDPGNLGTIIRTAAAAGYSLVLGNCADVFSPKVVRSSMSAIMTADFAFGGADTLALLKSKGVLVLAADAGGQNIYDITQKDIQGRKICIVIGNEANGISQEILNLCDKSVSIPMQGVESLNAATAAAVLMYHLKYGVKS